MSSQLRPLMIGLVVVGLLVFLLAIGWSGKVSIDHVRELKAGGKPQSEWVPAEVPQVITLVMAGIGAALATFFGALFGISQFTGGNPRPIPKWYQVNVWATLPERKRPGRKEPEMEEVEEAFGEVPVAPETAEQQEQLLNRVQVFAVYAYVVGLVGAAVLWGITGFSPYAADPIRNLSTAFLGVLAGVMTVALTVRQ